MPRENSIDIDTEEDFEMADLPEEIGQRATAVEILLYDWNQRQPMCQQRGYT